MKNIGFNYQYMYGVLLLPVIGTCPFSWNIFIFRNFSRKPIFTYKYMYFNLRLYGSEYHETPIKNSEWNLSVGDVKFVYKQKNQWKRNARSSLKWLWRQSDQIIKVVKKDSCTLFFFIRNWSIRNWGCRGP